MVIASGKSELKSAASSCAKACLAMTVLELVHSSDCRLEENVTFKCLFNVDGLLGTSFKIGNIPLGMTESHGSLGRYHPLAFVHIYLVANNNKGKVLWVHGTGLYQELVPPAIQSLETLGVVDIVH
jgi:hypothetical protein